MLLDSITLKSVAFSIDRIVANIYACIYMSDETAIVVDLKGHTNAVKAAVGADERECVNWRLGGAGVISMCACTANAFWDVSEYYQ
jgi:hypothetical protein